jgi:hypothetical protein
MTDQVLTVLRFVLLALLYLFFARVLWAVWSEVRTSGRTGTDRSVPAPGSVVGPASPTVPTARPDADGTDATKRQATPGKPKRGKATRGRKGRAGRLVILEPKARRGSAYPIAGEVTLGRDPECTISIGDDAFVSHRHLRIFDYDGQPMVEDLGSTNGTYHNGNKLIGARLLHPGDRIQVGTILIEAQ